MRDFSELSEREILALAIGAEEEDGRIYADLAESLHADFPASAKVFFEMAAEESDHRRRLIDLFQEKFGNHIPLIRRQDVRGFLARKTVWQMAKPRLRDVRKLAESMEAETARFYRLAAANASDASIRRLLGDLAEAEQYHGQKADRLTEDNLPDSVRKSEDQSAERNFVLRYVQPGLVGLMDGSVSTLAPIFAAAFATGRPWDAFLVGLSASLGAGISMGFAEALSDDGSLTGRGSPLIRGIITGAMTTLGGIGHTLPFLIPRFSMAITIAVIVVVIELAVITWIRAKYFETAPVRAAMQIALGGAIVFGVGIAIGSS
jgi:rubrerythrin